MTLKTSPLLYFFLKQYMLKKQALITWRLHSFPCLWRVEEAGTQCKLMWQSSTRGLEEALLSWPPYVCSLHYGTHPCPWLCDGDIGIGWRLPTWRKETHGRDQFYPNYCSDNPKHTSVGCTSSVGGRLVRTKKFTQKTRDPYMVRDRLRGSVPSLSYLHWA